MGQIYKIAYKNNLALSSALLTVENYSQALERSEVSKKNLGGLAAKTCLELIQKLNE
jgi:6,7-dimethyl-8-ribityllumazine synthase